MDIFKLFTQYTIPGSDIFLDLPTFGGFFEKGFFSAVGMGMFFFLSLIVVVWVALGIYAAFLIISSFGAEDKIKKGWTTIKSVWIGITYMIGFFLVVTIVGVFIGIGSPWNWAENLQQCAAGGPASGRFYFQGVEVNGENITVSEQLSNLPPANYPVYCCENGDVESVVVGSGGASGNCQENSRIGSGGSSGVPACVASGGICSPGTSTCCSPSEVCVPQGAAGLCQ